MDEKENIEGQPATDGQPPGQTTPEQTNVPEIEGYPSTLNPQLSTENMEVHHHAHAGHGKKTWKAYFWEFLMLFLAVFCGFLAEYQLEHKIEKDRESEYMESLLGDLHRDTAGIREVYELGQQQKLLIDTLLQLLNNEPFTGDNITKLYSANVNSTRIVNVDFENRTASQLKNAGGMRLIHKKTVVDSILVYWRFIDICNTISARLERLGENRFYLSARIFHNKYYVPSKERLTAASGIREGATLISNDPALMAEYSNTTFAKQKILNNYLLRMQESKAMAVRLMDVIRKEYHLE